MKVIKLKNEFERNNNPQAGRNWRIVLLVILVVLIILSSRKTHAQDTIGWKLNSFSVCSGETPLSSGLAISTAVSKKKHLFMCDYNSILGEVLYFYAPIKQFSFGYSAGVFKNTFYHGPIAALNLLKGHITTLNWTGLTFGDPGGDKTPSKMKFCFSYQQFNFNLKQFQAYYVLLHYQKCVPEHIFGVKGDFKVYDKFSISLGLGYMLHEEKFLWSTGVNYKFN